MKNIKTYEDFVNEEINLRKGLMGAALGAGLALSNPVLSQNNQTRDTVLTQRVNSPIVLKKNDIGTVDLKNDINGYYLDKNNIWQNLKPYDTINNEFQEFPSYLNILNMNGWISSEEIVEYNKVLIITASINTSLEMMYFLIDKEEFKSLSNLDINKTYIFSLVGIYEHTNYSRPTNIETDKAIKISIDSNKESRYKLYVKVGYVDGKKIVRFAIVSSDSGINFENCYYELPYDIFSKFLMN